jgi:seryl-tRNA synthetase
MAWRVRSHREKSRHPHPDAVVEAQLQRILSLRKLVALKEELAARDYEEIRQLRHKFRKRILVDGHGAQACLKQANSLQEEVKVLADEIARAHDEIAALTRELNETDLAWL